MRSNTVIFRTITVTLKAYAVTSQKTLVPLIIVLKVGFGTPCVDFFVVTEENNNHLGYYKN